MNKKNVQHKTFLLITLTFVFAYSLISALAYAQVQTDTPPPADTAAPVITDVATTAVPPNGMKVEWMTDEVATYIFEYGTTQSYGTETTSSSATKGGAVTLQNISPDTKYYYCIHATDASGNTGNSCDSFMTDPAPDTTASIISGIANQEIFSTSIKIVWETDEKAYSKVRYGATENLGSETSVETTATLLHETTIFGLTPSTKYYYCIDATDVAGNRSDSCGHTFTTAMAIVVQDTEPPASSNLAVESITPFSVKLTWLTNEGAKVQVRYGPTIDYGSITNQSRNFSLDHSVNLYRLQPLTLYHYRTRSVDRAGNVSMSEDETFTTAALSELIVPNPVTPVPPPSFVDGASESGAVRTERIRGYRGQQSSDIYQKISALGNIPVSTIPMPVLFGVALKNISPNFGDPRSGGRTHEGEDIMAVKGTPIVSPTAAVVLRTEVGASEGNAVYTANPGGETFVYMHLDRFGEGVAPGTVLQVGSLIGYVGNTGNASGGAAHLHFETHNSSGTPVDPFPRLSSEFTLAQKISFLNAILGQTSDSAALSILLVTNFRSTFVSAGAANIALPPLITAALVSVPQTAVSATGGSLPAGDLTVGSSGPLVVTLQKYLIQANKGAAAMRLSAAGATGTFGAITKAALVEYQASVGISPASGYYGPLTRAFVSAHPLGVQTAPVVTPSPVGTPIAGSTFTRDLRLGMSGEDVRALQKLLNTTGYLVATTGVGSSGHETAYFGPATKSAVVRFQAAFHVPATGYVGPLTRAALSAL